MLKVCPIQGSLKLILTLFHWINSNNKKKPYNYQACKCWVTIFFFLNKKTTLCFRLLCSHCSDTFLWVQEDSLHKTAIHYCEVPLLHCRQKIFHLLIQNSAEVSWGVLTGFSLDLWSQHCEKVLKCYVNRAGFKCVLCRSVNVLGSHYQALTDVAGAVPIPAAC